MSLFRYGKEASMTNLTAFFKRKVVHIAITFIALSAPLLHSEDLFFDSAGAKIRYTIAGQGEPVLLIHGFLVNIESNWAIPGAIKELSSNFQVIAIDNRGHGKSGKPHDPKAYGIQMVEDSIRLLDHLKIEKAHIVGYSMGARITVALLGFHPERFRTAVIGGFGWTPPGDESLKRLETEVAESLEQGKGLEPLIRSLTPAGMIIMPEQIAAANKMFLAENDPLALAAVMRGSVPSPTEAELKKASKIPVLALIGELDPRKSGVDRLNGILPGIKTVVIPKATHMSAFSSPEFIKNLKAFLLQHPADN
jgi:pimeloyl-ACP methyl ester carboxylesterase